MLVELQDHQIIFEYENVVFDHERLNGCSSISYCLTCIDCTNVLSYGVIPLRNNSKLLITAESWEDVSQNTGASGSFLDLPLVAFLFT